MNRSILPFCVVLITVLFALTITGITGQAFAADDQTSKTTGETMSSEKSQAMNQSMIRADKLIGQKAVDSQGEDLGEIKDLVIGKEGKVEYLILSQGGVAGVGAKLVPVPYKKENISMQEDEITLQNVDKAKLQNAPTFTEDEYQKLSEQSFKQEVRGYFGDEKSDMEKSKSRAMNKDMTRADDLIGQKAVDSQGEDLGEIKDLVIGKEGKVEYLILSQGGVAGVGAELVPVPYKKENISMQEDEITLQNVDKAKLENAPTFTEDEYQKLSEQSFKQEVRGYFGDQKSEVKKSKTEKSSTSGRREAAE